LNPAVRVVTDWNNETRKTSPALRPRRMCPPRSTNSHPHYDQAEGHVSEMRV
jgi:hypothetical protein